MAVDRMQWGAEKWQFADLYTPDVGSPYASEHGIPCVMLIHGGFWKEKYGLELMKPIAEDLAEAGIAAWNVEFKRWSEMIKEYGWILYLMSCELGVNWPYCLASTS
ncbi:MAG: hypothetical protein CM15mP2_3190 [Methanobacteriota archaeon]|nr:MAG: hypothetical protein CM15mP2_3190 [Euryarchaeota archaeon]